MSMENRIRKLLGRLPELETDLSSPDVLKDKKRYKTLASEHKYLVELQTTWDQFRQCKEQLAENKSLAKEESDPSFLSVIEEEIASLSEQEETLQKKVEILLVPPDENDDRNTIMELRAGTGGDESALFVGDCVRMYRRLSENQGWSFEPLSNTPSEAGGFKEYQFVLSGNGVNRFMRYEAGTHRVQRVPQTESQGRVHTSAITVAAIIEPDEEEEVVIDEKELRIDTYRSSGAGGQHVNTTDSAVRITHLPTGIVVHCQDERSQIKNRAKAMRLLIAKIAEEKRKKQEQDLSSTRAQQIGSGDRSERIRTYNFPQNRVTDHRINLTLYKLDEIMEGRLELIIEPLMAHFYQKQLTHEG